LSLKIVAILFSAYALAFLFFGVALTIHAQSDIQTTKHRDMVIDLGNGLKTNARLNLPATGDGPFPAVLLIHGIGANFTLLDSNVWGNVTVDELKQDAEKALDVLVQQPQVDANHVTLIGHSEGTIIVPRVAIDNPRKVDNIVLMGTVAQNFSDIGYLQGVTLPILYVQQVLDHNHNGLISVQETSENPVFSSLVGNLTLILAHNITTANGTVEQLNPRYNTNNDTFININDELKPRLIDAVKSLPVVIQGERCTFDNLPCPIWIASQYALTPNLDIIGKVPSDTSILIQQGKNDSQTPIQQAFLLEQELTEVRHPDHTLITYPDLGHAFYPSSQWLTALGPMEQTVLEDLFGWLTDPVRDFKKLSVLSSQIP
jgi:uncharacterized protein